MAGGVRESWAVSNLNATILGPRLPPVNHSSSLLESIRTCSPHVGQVLGEQDEATETGSRTLSVQTLVRIGLPDRPQPGRCIRILAHFGHFHGDLRNAAQGMLNRLTRLPEVSLAHFRHDCELRIHYVRDFVFHALAQQETGSPFVETVTLHEPSHQLGRRVL